MAGGYALATPSADFYERGDDVFDDWDISRTRAFGEDGFYQISETTFRPVIAFESLGENAALAYSLGEQIATKYPDRIQDKLSPMHKVRKIMVVLEAQQEEQPALTRAAYIADATGASLHLFMSAYDRAVGIASFLTGKQKSLFVRTVVDGSRVMAQRLAQPFQEKGISVTIEIVWDRHPSDAIIKASKSGQYDLLMKYARQHMRTDAMFNHIDWNLLRYSPCPVMLVKTGQWDDVGQVLAAIDAAPESQLHN